VETLDSGEETKLDRKYLPGGTITLLTGKIVGMIEKTSIRKDKLGRWNSIRIEGGNKKMQIINVYRITESTQEGILKTRAQFDRVNGKVKSSKQYRDEMLADLSTEITKIKEEGVKEILITRDINQDINYRQIQQFM